MATTEEYPLSLELFDKMHPNTIEPAKRMTKGHGNAKKSSLTTRHARTQLVSADLCGTSSPEQEGNPRIYILTETPPR